MSRPANPDPFKMWRDALDQAEAGINSMAGDRLVQSEDFAKFLNQYSKINVGVQQVIEKTLTRIFERLDIPSRRQLEAQAATLQRIEDKLDQLLPAREKAEPQVRLPRTRKPPPDVAPEAAAQPTLQLQHKPAAKPATRPAAKPAAKVARKRTRP